MKLKKASLLFLLILIIVLVFVIGVRRGQQVEKTNKIINYLISIPPSATAQPTQIPLNFKEYTHKGCGMKFLYPGSWKIEESSSTASLKDKKILQLSFNCDQGLKPALPHPNSPTAVVLFKNKKTKVYLTSDRNSYDFTLTNIRNGKIILILINKSFFSLFEKTLEFLP